MRNEVYVDGRGDRPDKPNVAVIITDGHSNVDSHLTGMEALQTRDAGIRIFVIGVGNNQSIPELQSMASLPPYWHISLFEEVEDVNQHIDAIHSKVCTGGATSIAL